MTIIVTMVVVNSFILLLAIKFKCFLYTITPEQQWSKEIDKFDRNNNIIKALDISDYKLGDGHLYE